MAGDITGKLNSLRGAAAGAFDAIASALPKLEAGIPQNLRKIAEGATAKANNEGADAAATVSNQQAGSQNATGVATGTASSAYNPFAALQTAGNTFLNSVQAQLSPAINTLQGIGPNLSKFANNITSTNTTDSASAGGLNSLPGGQQATAIVTNLKDSIIGTVNALPGTQTIKALIDSKVSGVTNAVSTVDSIFNGAINTANQLTDAAKKVGTAFDNLTVGKGLASLAQAGLPASAIAKVDAIISSFSSLGAAAVKMATVATNTDGTRPALAAQTKAQLDNPVIPPPNYDRQLTGAESEEIKNNLAKLGFGPTEPMA
jgi:hypothetical protein